MGYTSGFKWEDHHIDRLKELILLGLTTDEIAAILSKEFNAEFNHSTIMNVRSRHALLRNILKRDPKATYYKERVLPYQDCMVSCDYHSPYFSELWVNRLLGIADVFKIKINIIAGDLFDMNFAKYVLFQMAKGKGEGDSSLDEESELSMPLIDALKYFDKTYLIAGNHETRLDRMTLGKVQFYHLLNYLWGADADERVEYSAYDKLRLGSDWLVVHPKSYSQVSASVAIRLAEKFHCHALNAHGHFTALRFDRSGKHMGIDLGGMFDVEKVEYINKKTTTHPFWNNGFGMIYNDKFYHFHEGTDWQFWGLA